MKNMPPGTDLLHQIASAHANNSGPLAIAADQVLSIGALHEGKKRISNKFAGSRVALAIENPIDFITAVCLLDGFASAILLISPSLSQDARDKLCIEARIDEVVNCESDLAGEPIGTRNLSPLTEWLMTTSGTTGTPKIVTHSLGSLTRSVKPPRAANVLARWGLLYEPSRFAGLQVVLQSLCGAGVLLVSDSDTPLNDRLEFLAAEGCTHLSATPSLWRRILMSPAHEKLPLQQVTLGGEIADNRILSALKRAFPEARISHIYASTELGVGFAVTDGRAGFPARWFDAPEGGLEMRMQDGMLWIRPPEKVARPSGSHIKWADGYLCTEDRILREGDRILFLGRDVATANVGGTKIQLEEVEDMLRQHPDVSECLFRSVPNPIVGSVLHAQIVPANPAHDIADLKRSIRRWCKANLQAEAVPAKVEVVEALPLSAGGKLLRENT